MAIIGVQAIKAAAGKPEDILKDVPLSLYGGQVTEMEPGDLPEGASPFCQDVDFALGEVFTRAGLTALFSGQISGSCNFIKNFTLPNEDLECLVYDSAGNFYYEDTTNTPGTLVSVASVAPALLPVSISQFGREYIAFGDGNVGVDIPRQWDGTYFDRVSQEGPGASPSAADEVISFTIAAIGIPGAALYPDGENITAATESGNLVTLTLQFAFAANSVKVGDAVIVTGVTPAGYNGSFVISYLNGTTLQYINTVTGLGAGTIFGIATVNFLAFTTTANTNFVAGQQVTVAGCDASYNGTYNIRFLVGLTLIYIAASAAQASNVNQGGGTIAASGNIQAGVRGISCAFLTRQGYITRFSPPNTWTATGNLRVIVTGIPIGPSNIIARIIAFTAAGGAYYFYIPVVTTGSTTGTQINDNTTTTTIIDFSDATLLSASGINNSGNNLFALDTLAPCAGVFAYADRMQWWGELNKLQNLLNLSFDGGFIGTTLTGWLTDGTSGAGGAKSTTAVWGFSYQITGDGASALRGMITQPAFQDYLMVSILRPNTAYSVRLRLKKTGAPTQGNAVVELYSPGSGSLGSFVVAESAISSTGFSFHSGALATTGAVIPSDLLLRVYASGTLTNAATILFDEIELFPTNQPYLQGQVRVSYVANPESFDGVTGILAPTEIGSQSLRSLFELRDTLYLSADAVTVDTSDNGQEPFTWSFTTLSRAIGACSVRATARGEDWELLASQKGLYITNGSEPMKISQENAFNANPNSPAITWDLINWQYGKTIWMVNDDKNRRVLIGAPINGSTVPNVVFMMNYRELNASWMLAQQGPIHISYAGKMISWDMSRKWSTWNIYANCAAIITQQNGVTQTYFGNNLSTNKVYLLDPSALSDDGTAIVSSYYTFFFVNRELEQTLQMGLVRKVYLYLSAFIYGSGSLSAIAVAETMGSPRSKTLASRTLTANPGNRREIGINFTAACCTFGFSTGNPGAYFRLAGKLLVSMRRDPYMPIRGIG